MVLGPPRRYRPRSAAACSIPGVTQYELQYDLKMATCAGLGSAWERPSCKLSPAAVSAVPGTTSQEVWACRGRCILFGVYELLRDFRKIGSMNLDRLFIWTSHWKQFGWACKLGGVGSQEITRAVNSGQVGGDSDMVPTCQFCRGRAQQRNNGFC